MSMLRRRKPLNRVSAKKAAADAELADARRARQRLTGGLCEGDTPACPTWRHTGLHAHHVLRRSQGGGHTVGNLRWLCWAGHEWVHRHPAEARRRGLLG